MGRIIGDTNCGNRFCFTMNKHYVIAGLAAVWVLVGQISVISGAWAEGEGSPSDLSDHAPQILRGKNILLTVNCNDCHTAGYARSGGKVPEEKWLLGDDRNGFSTPQGVIHAPNLRAVVAKLSESQWIQLARNMNKRPPMPQHTLRAMSDGDLKALYWFIKSLGPVGQSPPSLRHEVHALGLAHVRSTAPSRWFNQRPAKSANGIKCGCGRRIGH